jgi:penicillin-binding protein 2
MDVQSGDILALASSPSINPNYFIQSPPAAEWQRLNELHAQMNRATYGSYFPGSIFKLVVGLACLESGLNPAEKMTVAENPAQRGKGHIIVRGRSIKDTAPPGDYDFRRALMLSCNSYFISNGLRTGPEKIISLAQHAHFGERTGLKTRQEVTGSLPSLGRVHGGWGERNTANISIGQDPIRVTPLQIAVLTSAIANGGKVLWPRLVQRIESQDAASSDAPVVYPAGQVRDQLGVSDRSLQVLYDAMLADTEDREGTGRHVRDHEPLPGLRIFGKTGTAQIQDVHGNKNGQTTWFASFASIEKSRYAVVVMVENGKSGGETCCPVAGHIYAALQKRETARPKPEGVVRN